MKTGSILFTEKAIPMTELATLKPSQIKKVLGDPEAAAKLVHLHYVNDGMQGIVRKKIGKNYQYFIKEKKVSDDKILDRINALVIPPAWENVWICKAENGHLQATGQDIRGRKQYMYHDHWKIVRSQTKYHRLYAFGEALPKIRLVLEKDLAKQGIKKEKVLAAVVSLMERTHIRVGNTMYEKLYGSYGLTTLKDKHVKIKGAKINFHFVGKKGVEHCIDIRHKKLSKIVQSCRDIPGKELFQFYDEDHKRHAIDSGMVNDYIKEASGAQFTAKDFRTWAGSVEALLALNELGFAETETDTKKKTVEALDKVSELLGNTRTVCKKYYVHPSILSLYADKGLKAYLNELDKIEVNDKASGLTAEEQVLMKILKKS